MKLHRLRALLAIAEHGSYSEAAVELGTSQSTLSHAIAELEADLGVRLLERGRFGAAPTEVGARVVAHARRLECVLDAIRQEAQLERGELAGSVRVSAFRSAASFVLPKVMARLARSHPGLRVDVHELATECVDVTDALHAGTVDLAVTMSFLADDAIFWELVRDPYVAVVPARARGGEEAELADLLTGPILLSSGPCAQPADESLVALDPAFAPAYRIAEDSTILAMVAEGLGSAVMPELTLDGGLPAGTKRLRLRPTVERSVGVALLPSALRLPAVRAVLIVLKDMFPASEIPALGMRGAPSGVQVRSAR